MSEHPKPSVGEFQPTEVGVERNLVGPSIARQPTQSLLVGRPESGSSTQITFVSQTGEKVNVQIISVVDKEAKPPENYSLKTNTHYSLGASGISIKITKVTTQESGNTNFFIVEPPAKQIVLKSELLGIKHHHERISKKKKFGYEQKWNEKKKKIKPTGKRRRGKQP